MSFYSWFLDLMHWKVKQKKCRSVCYHRKPQKCDQCNRRKSAQSTAAWSLSCSAIAMGLTPWCNFHSERGISENTMHVPCTWHQKMVIAWDEVVRVWRDMAPGLVFCDTSLHIHPCYYRGRILWKRRGKSGGTLVLRGTLVVHAVQYGHSIEQAGWMYSTHKGSTIT